MSCGSLPAPPLLPTTHWASPVLSPGRSLAQAQHAFSLGGVALCEDRGRRPLCYGISHVPLPNKKKTLIHALNQWVSNLGMRPNHLESLLEYRALSPTPEAWI